MPAQIYGGEGEKRKLRPSWLNENDRFINKAASIKVAMVPQDDIVLLAKQLSFVSRPSAIVGCHSGGTPQQLSADSPAQRVTPPYPLLATPLHHPLRESHLCHCRSH